MRPQLPLFVVIAIVYLCGTAGVYAAAGLTAFPRQEWIIEMLASAIFMMPVLALLHSPGPLLPGIRFLGFVLIAHALWDAAHWPGYAWIPTPIDPLVPKLCPIGDILIGSVMLAVDATRRDSRS